MYRTDSGVLPQQVSFQEPVLCNTDYPALPHQNGFLPQLLYVNGVFHLETLQNRWLVVLLTSTQFLNTTKWKGKKEITQRIEEVLNEVGMIDKIDKMPHELSE